MKLKSGTRLSIFPLAGAILLPGSFLPLHIFEPRYRALVSDALARDRRIAMIQPRPGQDDVHPELFEIGCVGKVVEVEALEDGRFNLVLEGQSRFRLLREMEVTTPFRQVEADLGAFPNDGEEQEPLASIRRAGVEQAVRDFVDTRGFAVDWDGLGRLDDESLVSGLSQILPFDVAAKQALLEAPDLVTRADLLVQFLRFLGEDGTLQ
jgi:uncharacterized protein